MAESVARFDLIVGLGNPGSEYESTRHNAGFWFIESLARLRGASFSTDKKSGSKIARARVGDHPLLLQKPDNFMNRSGHSVRAITQFYKLDTARVLVVHDELDLPAGQLRIKHGGGHGGHNGLRDIIAQLGTGDFSRLRIGIGHPGHKSQVVGYVLKRASASDQILIDEAVELAQGQSDALVAGDLGRATQALHSHKPQPTEQ